jgi:serine-type D-Ala-D-Ala carboxypeptidase (penicillin-binding protein 5/6)
VKTGYTERAGECLIAAARRDGRTMLAVVMNGANPDQTAKQLLDEGFATPVSAEAVADRLPPVSAAALVPAGSAPGPAASSTVSSADAPPLAAQRVVVPGTPVTRGRSSRVPWLALTLLAVVAGLVAVGLLRRRIARRRPAPTRRHALSNRHAA